MYSKLLFYIILAHYLQIFQMIQYILTLILIALVAIFYKFYYTPKKALDWYKRTLEGLGYKVKLFPIQFFGCPIYSDFSKDAIKFNDSQVSIKKYYTEYDVLLFNLLDKPMVSLLNPELTKNFFMPDNIYVHHKMKFAIANIQRSLGHGMAFSEGKQWKRKRHIISAVFNYDFIIENIPKINRITEDALNQNEKICIESGHYEVRGETKVYKMKILDIFSKAFSNVILESFFGITQKINNQQAASFINTLSSDITQQNFSLPVLIFGTKFAELGLRKKDKSINQRIKALRQFAKNLIEKRLKQLQKTGPREKYQDIIEALVLKKSFDNTSSKDVKISKQLADQYDYNQLIDEFCTFFTGGSQTTSNFTQMMIYYIALDKRIEDKLRAQIDEFIKTNQDLTKENLKKLTYIDWIQNQTLRYYGPGNGLFTRIAQKDHYIVNIPILKGTAIDMNPVPSHFNEAYYKNPFQFRPERWQSECDSNHPFAFVGFSAGPRSCIGKHLALLQNKIGLVKFMRRYKQIKLPKKDFKMVTKFLYQAEPMLVEVSK